MEVVEPSHPWKWGGSVKIRGSQNWGDDPHVVRWAVPKYSPLAQVIVLTKTEKLMESHPVQIAWIDSARRIYPQKYKDLYNHIGTMEFWPADMEYLKAVKGLVQVEGNFPTEMSLCR